MDQVSQIREKIDIVSLIQEYIPLKKTGSNFKTTCPFHNEKTPSFVVSSQRQIWHCFGCGKGGDCFSFLMEYEHLEFGEALRILAKKTGIELKLSFGESAVSSKKEKIYKLNKLACDFYHYILVSHSAGKKALQYVTEQRRIHLAVLSTFKVGFAPSFGDALSEYLIKKKHYTKEDLIEAGLAFQRGIKIYDFFSNRLMFALIDHRDNIVGFSGRILTNDKTVSKYVNTKETAVYHKGSHFFGLNIAKEEIKKEERAIITEGEFDVMSCFQEGIGNVVAVKGTALTENQVQLIARFTQKVSLCFDADTAGKEAIKRSLPALEKKGVTTTVIIPLEGKDPDESLKINPVEFKKAIKHDISVYEYLINQALEKFDSKTAEGKKQISQEVLPFIILIENEIVKEHFLRKLSIELATSFESILKEADRLLKKETAKPIFTIQKQKKSRQEVLSEYLLALIIQYDQIKIMMDDITPIISEEVFGETSYKKLFENLKVFLANHETFDRNIFMQSLPQELLSVYDTCFLFPRPQFATSEKYKEEILKTAKELKNVYLHATIKLLGETIKGKETQGKTDDITRLEKEFNRLVGLLQTI